MSVTFAALQVGSKFRFERQWPDLELSYIKTSDCTFQPVDVDRKVAFHYRQPDPNHTWVLPVESGK